MILVSKHFTPPHSYNRWGTESIVCKGFVFNVTWNIKILGKLNDILYSHLFWLEIDTVTSWFKFHLILNLIWVLEGKDNSYFEVYVSIGRVGHLDAQVATNGRSFFCTCCVYASGFSSSKLNTSVYVLIIWIRQPEL